VDHFQSGGITDYGESVEDMRDAVMNSFAGASAKAAADGWPLLPHLPPPASPL
jgi:hypothetical protein